jgi:aminoacrylate hydrolase
MARPVLLIPGLGGRGSFWARQSAALSGRFWPIACDLRARETVQAMAQDVLAVLDAAGIGRCHVVGHSTGGAIAQVIAQDHPQRVDRLVLSATWSAPTEPFTALFTLRQRILVELGIEAYALHGALIGWPNDWLEAHPEQLRDFDAADVPALTARLKAILAFDRSAHLESIRAPTLVLCAADDAVVPLGHSRRIAAAIGGATLQVLPGGGHFPQATATDAYNALLVNFLEQTDG